MPLVWAHAECIKLLRSLQDGQVFDTPPQTYQRYVIEKISSPLVTWRLNAKRQTIPAGKILRLEVPQQTVIEWSTDEWKTSYHAETQASGLGLHYTDLQTAPFPTGTTICFRIGNISDPTSQSKETFRVQLQ